jgi:sedoheptulokinase
MEDNSMTVSVGIDIGTTTICAVALEGESFELKESITRPNDSAMAGGKDYESVFDPERIAVIAADLVEGLQKLYSCACIGISNQMHGMVYVDRNGRAVGPFVNWQDRRGDVTGPGGKTWTAELSGLTGFPMATGYGLTTHFWFLLNGGVPDGAARIMTIGDYVAGRLCGETGAPMHISNAQSLGLFDMEKRRFDPRALEAAGMEEGLLPEISSRFSTMGHTEKGTPVVIPLGDNQASFLGSVSGSDAILVNMGTASQISLAVEEALASALFTRGERGFGIGGLEQRPLYEGYRLLAGSPLCGGDAYALLEKFFRECAAMVTGEEIASAYPGMDRCFEALGELENPLEVKTTFMGTRKDPSIRGAIRGIGVYNFTPGHLMRGFLEGMAGELQDLYKRAAHALPGKPRFLVGAGNGIRKNPALCRVLEKVFGLPLHIPLHREEAAFGAALAALTGAGFFPDIRDAQKRIRYTQNPD